MTQVLALRHSTKCACHKVSKPVHLTSRPQERLTTRKHRIPSLLVIWDQILAE